MPISYFVLSNNLTNEFLSRHWGVVLNGISCFSVWEKQTHGQNFYGLKPVCGQRASKRYEHSVGESEQCTGKSKRSSRG